MNDNKAERINAMIKDSIEEKSIVFTDKSTSYIDITDYIEFHIEQKSDKHITKTSLKWVHIAISNAKRNLLGNYYKIKGKHL